MFKNCVILYYSIIYNYNIIYYIIYIYYIYKTSRGKGIKACGMPNVVLIAFFYLFIYSNIFILTILFGLSVVYVCQTNL